MVVLRGAQNIWYWADEVICFSTFHVETSCWNITLLCNVKLCKIITCLFLGMLYKIFNNRSGVVTSQEKQMLNLQHQCSPVLPELNIGHIDFKIKECVQTSSFYSNWDMINYFIYLAFLHYTLQATLQLSYTVIRSLALFYHTCRHLLDRNLLASRYRMLHSTHL